MNQIEQPNEGRELSSREIEVLRLVAEGMRTQEIADALSIHRDTVEAHRHNIIRATKCKNMVHVIATALRAGVIA